MHMLLIDDNNECWSFGQNDYGQLGLGDFKALESPKKIMGISGIVKVSNSYVHSVFLDNNGEVWACGYNKKNRLGIDGGIRGSVKRLFNTKISIPRKIHGLKSIKKINTGTLTSFFLDDELNVWACGNNNYGQLGLGDFNHRSKPTKNKRLRNIVKMCCGSNHSIFIDKEGYGWCFGHNYDSQLGLGHNKNINIPTLLPLSTRIIHADCGDRHTMIIDEQHNTLAFGNNEYGQCGSGDFVNILNPIKISRVPKYKKVKCSATFTVFLDFNDHVWFTGAFKCITSRINIPLKLEPSQEINKIIANYFNIILIDKSDDIFIIEDVENFLCVRKLPNIKWKKTL